MISFVCTSFNRKDLLLRTIESFLKFNTYPIDKFIIIEDSADKDMCAFLEKHNFHLPASLTIILNIENIGAYESIDLAYSHVTAPFVLHCEDDWEFFKGDFIGPSIKILENDPMIMQVNLSNEENMEILPDVYQVGDIDYRIMGADKDGFWHGYSNRPNIRSMAGYMRTKPWTQWSTKEDFLALREMKVGARYYELGFKAAVLNDYYCVHTGKDRCTWHE